MTKMRDPYLAGWNDAIRAAAERARTQRTPPLSGHASAGYALARTEIYVGIANMSKPEEIVNDDYAPV